MALNQFSRTQLLLGQESMDLLADATVAVFGIGGVGGSTRSSAAAIPWRRWQEAVSAILCW